MVTKPDLSVGPASRWTGSATKRWNRGTDSVQETPQKARLRLRIGVESAGDYTPHSGNEPMVMKRRAALMISLACAVLAACGGNGTEANGPSGSFPRWEGELRTLFDDEIDSTAVGLAMDGRSPAADPLLGLRAQSAEIAARVRVQTVTRDTAGARTSYTLTLQIGMPPLMPLKLQRETIDLSITPATGAFGIVQSLEASMRGRTFIGFARRFAGAEGPELHWHLAADDAEVAKIVQELAVMEELAGE
jgi:hypothetical protein